MKRLKVFAFTAVLIALALAPVWAGGGGEKKSDGPVTLRFAYWGGDARIEIYNKIIQRYQEDNPNVKVTLEPSSWNDYFTKLSTQVAGGGAPDVISMHPRYMRYYSSNNALLPLDSLIAAKTIDLTNFSDGAINMGKIDGKTWMVSTGTVATGIFVNETIFNELGIPLTRFDGNFDWAAWEKLAIEVTQKSNGRYTGTGDDSFTPNDTAFTIFMRSRGKDFFTPDGKIAFDKADLKEWLSLFDRLRKAGAIGTAQHAGESANQTWEQSDQVAGTVGFWFLNANRLRIYQDQMPKHHLIMKRAPNYNGNYGEYLEGSGISINAKTKYPQEVAQFINYFVNTERSLELFRIEHGFPASSVMNQYVYTLLDPSNRLAAQFMDTVTSKGKLPDYVLPPDNWTEILNLLGQESQAVAYGTKTIDKAVDDFFAAVGRLY
ncbi:ABC transporter ATP-binding protein [Spirochaetia bacterium]|nr:ABC transporter ATP-binding protein [Spirochaetia bacterium]